MKFNDTIRLRIFKDKLLYITVCVLSGLTAIPLLAILGEVLIKGWNVPIELALFKEDNFLLSFNQMTLGLTQNDSFTSSS